MADTVIPNGGTTDDQTPELRIILDAPLWDGSSIHVFRNGLDIGLATARSELEYTFTDNVIDGAYVYTARVVLGANVSNSSAYSINVEQPPPPLPMPFITGFYETIPNESVILMEDGTTVLHETTGALLTEIQGAPV